MSTPPEPLFALVADEPPAVEPRAPGGRGRRPRWRWVAGGLGVAALVTAVLLTGARDGRTTSGSPEPVSVPPAMSTPRTVGDSTTGDPSTGPTRSEEPTWPTDDVGSECRSITDTATSLAAVPAPEPVGVTVIVGPGITVDLDTGDTVVPDIPLEPREVVTALLVNNGRLYVTAADCRDGTERHLEVSADGTVTPVRVPIAEGEHLGPILGGPHGPLVTIYDETYASSDLQAITGGPLLGMPDLWPVAWSGDIVAAASYDPGGTEMTVIAHNIVSGERTEIVTLGPEYNLVTNERYIVWLNTQEPSGARHDLATGVTTPLTGTTTRSLYLDQLSPDGRYVLATREVEEPDLDPLDSHLDDEWLYNYRVQTLVIDLDTGEELVVPGLEQTIQDGSLATVFVTDNRGNGHILVVAHQRDGATHFATWKPGQGSLWETGVGVTETQAAYLMAAPAPWDTD